MMALSLYILACMPDIGLLLLNPIRKEVFFFSLQNLQAHFIHDQRCIFSCLCLWFLLENDWLVI